MEDQDAFSQWEIFVGGFFSLSLVIVVESSSSSPHVLLYLLYSYTTNLMAQVYNIIITRNIVILFVLSRANMSLSLPSFQWIIMLVYYSQIYIYTKRVLYIFFNMATLLFFKGLK